jgi:branched-subunit amino acid aminotransferase/4-amino-4-deoxychorismate lyase
MDNVNDNGVIRQEGVPLFGSGNRAFRYGDGLFESLRVFEGRIPFWHYHAERIFEGMAVLWFDAPFYFDADFLRAEIEKLLAGSKGNHFVRLAVYREDGGRYAPVGNAPKFFIEASPLHDGHFVLGEQPLHLGIFQAVPLVFNALSPFKTANALPYVLAARWAEQHHFDDCLLLNQDGHIAEATSSNIFIVNNKNVITPPLSEACLMGTMRRFLLENLPSPKFYIMEAPLYLSDLISADGVFLTNAVSGVRLVNKIEDTAISMDKKEYINEIIHLMNNYVKMA